MHRNPIIAVLLVAVLTAPVAALPTAENTHDTAMSVVASWTPSAKSPPLGHEAKILAPSPEPESYFGDSIAYDGETLAVAAPQEGDGRVHLYEREEAGWKHVQSLSPPNNTETTISAQFGRTVDLDGDILVVGDPQAWTDGAMNAGLVYFYQREGSVWTLEHSVAGTDLVDSDDGTSQGDARAARSYYLGGSLAVGDDTVLAYAVGAYAVGDGRVHIFNKVNGTWQSTQVLFGADAAQDVGLAIHGDVAVIPNRGDNLVRVYNRTSEGWELAETLHDPSPGDSFSNDYFGWSVDIHGDQIIVGEFFGGDVHIFTHDRGWDLNVTIHKPNGASPSFGYPVAIEDGLALVGAPEEEMVGWRLPTDEAVGNDAGAIYVYTRSSLGWEPRGRITAIDAGRDDWFAWDMDLEGGTVAVGAQADDVDSRNSGPDLFGEQGELSHGDQGSAYILSPDKDGDGLSDQWELWHQTNASNLDTDGDLVDDGTEYICGWDPSDASSPTQGGEATGVAGPSVAAGETRWLLCGMVGEMH